MMKNYTDDEFRAMSNEQLEKELSYHEWLHRDLLHEYDKRCYEGRIKYDGEPIPPEKIQEYIHNKYQDKRKKKAS